MFAEKIKNLRLTVTGTRDWKEAIITMGAGLEMGPFSMLSDLEWRTLLTQTECRVAALSGYTFAIEPPSCKERPIDRQMEYWELLKRNFELVERHDAFGQNATPLLILKRK